ncbi:hypothetical protein QAD02_004498 [Eretmocerus hayati]|uniref:Uncharacterized protein n=1 Tax=Eretmocerus hayati TaxID=131215 RepID=A0ACC2NQ19_9HYME|nr:hypothetical protein QAD02_004498 [Eretmocerus hayati]
MRVKVPSPIPQFNPSIDEQSLEDTHAIKIAAKQGEPLTHAQVSILAQMICEINRPGGTSDFEFFDKEDIVQTRKTVASESFIKDLQEVPTYNPSCFEDLSEIDLESMRDFFLISE